MPPRFRPHSACSFAALALLLAPATALAGGAHDTTDFADVAELVRAVMQEHGPENVLLVCDIDNTLLAMSGGGLGSDQWFEWQRYLLDHEPESPMLVVDDWDGLLAAQGLLFTLGKMHPPQPDLPELVASLQDEGVRTLVLTSRSDDFRAATERELRANGYDFARTALPLKQEPPCDVFAPYDLESLADSGLTDKDVEAFELGEPRGVSYSEGVFMSAGQHKGVMLLTMLARSAHDYRAVVFVDDHGRHVLRVYDALVRREIDITAIHYQRQDDIVKAFEYSDKKEVAERWRQLDKTLAEVFE